MPPDARRSTLALVVLALLHTSPMHPYQVQQKLKLWHKEKVVNVRQRSGLYRTIERLHEAGLVEVHATEREEQRPERTVYAITDAGEAVLRQWQLEVLSTPAREFPQFPAALSVLAVVTEQEAIDALVQRCEALTADIVELEQDMADGTAMGVPRLFMIEDELVLAVTRAELTWVTGLVDLLRVGDLRWDAAWVEAQAETFARLDAEGGAPT